MIPRMVRIAGWAWVTGWMAGLAVPAAFAGSRDTRINLADFARVVEFTGDSPDVLEARELHRGPDGWAVWTGDGGQAMIGLEWDEPRDIVETNIEFRHAIAERDLIQVQYFARNGPVPLKEGQTAADPPHDAPIHDRWVTPPWEWWAGDRDVSFAFKSVRQERPDHQVPDVRYRRTRRLRFLCGRRDDLPPVRYLRAFGPSPSVDATFDIRFDRDADLAPPVLVSVVNGYVIAGDGKTTMEESRIGADPGEVRLRFAEGDVDSPNRTEVTLRTVREPVVRVSFVPAEVVKRGHLRLTDRGLTIGHRGTRMDPEIHRAPAAPATDHRPMPPRAQTQASPG